MYKLETHLHVAGTSPCAMTDEKTIAVVLPDGGDRYFSTPLFQEQ